MSKFNTFIFRLKSYFSYWLESLGEHSLQSPFIFGFYRDVLKVKSDKSLYSGIEVLRNSLLSDERIIEIEDLGAGSFVTSNLKRSVKDIAKSSLASRKTSELYCRIIDYFEIENILELGTSLGINTLYLATNPNVKKVYTIEGCGQTSKIASSLFKGISGEKITLLNSDIEKSFSDISYNLSKLDFILIDANHTYEATLKYYDICKKYKHENTIIIIDDIYWSDDMAKAWLKIKEDVEVTLSIDLYEMGIIFFKKNLQKENYILNW